MQATIPNGRPSRKQVVHNLVGAEGIMPVPGKGYSGGHYGGSGYGTIAIAGDNLVISRINVDTYTLNP